MQTYTLYIELQETDLDDFVIESIKTGTRRTLREFFENFASYEQDMNKLPSGDSNVTNAQIRFDVEREDA